VAYSSGSGQHIVSCYFMYANDTTHSFTKVTTDVGKDKCATTHGGTSAAAPNAVGVFALALEAR
jgi:kexin